MIIKMSAVLLGLQALAAEFETLLEIKETGNEKNIRSQTENMSRRVNPLVEVNPKVGGLADPGLKYLADPNPGDLQELKKQMEQLQIREEEAAAQVSKSIQVAEQLRAEKSEIEFEVAHLHAQEYIDYI
ncbi:uncharacterized protein LOC111715706 [Eurytemora carolleeae]|uniref:uncharacterized protein LOC111715706 n=1 Tax=Eurytemora carolleeae TaxID=1294199 RepID=UPI000C793459|nr:uncharacterized protein LOC111715706 [Eurytemora carolleeae]|eukprot:XP_023346838.1 uncharacterized protein LOC111715706 [Eurytemora affinis]